MKLLDPIIGLLARALLGFLRFIIPRVSDRAVGRFFRWVERLVYVITGDRDLTASVAELADIFETGPPFTVTARKLVAGMEPEIVESALKCLVKPSPYGSL